MFNLTILSWVSMPPDPPRHWCAVCIQIGHTTFKWLAMALVEVKNWRQEGLEPVGDSVYMQLLLLLSYQHKYVFSVHSAVAVETMCSTYC